MARDRAPSQDVLAAARRLQEQKLSSVARVVASREEIGRIQKELADAQRDDAAAYAEAVKAGWSEGELRSIGIAPPARQVPGRPRSAGRAKPKAPAPREASDEERKAADDLTALSEEMGTYDQPAPEAQPAGV